MSAAKRYTEEQVRKQVLEAFKIGMRIGEKRASRSEAELISAPNGVEISFPRLRLIRGGAA